MTKKSLLRPSALVLMGVLMATGLAGCGQKKNAQQQANAVPALPLAAGPATPIAPAPPPDALPVKHRVSLARVANPADRYAYVDRAYEMSDAIGQAPPDYGFDYDGTRPWVWRSSNREMRIVEPVDGGDRSYYYQPGSDEPYLVRDPYYSYGYSDGQLVAVYDRDGRLLPPDEIDQRADDASRYLDRGVELYQASLRRERQRVNAANWAERRAELDAERSRWDEDQNQQGDWRSYHQQHEGEYQAYWQGDRDQREREARSFDAWQNRGFNGPPPPPVGYAGQNYGNAPWRQADNSAQNTSSNATAPNAAQPTPTASSAQPALTQQRTDAAAQAKAAADAQAALAQQKAQAAAQQAQAKAAADAALQKAQADAARAKADAEAARQAQAKALADAAAQKAQAEAALAQQKSQAATQQAQTKAAADAAVQKAQADAARAQAQADAARKAQAQADAAAAAQRAQLAQAQAKAQAEATRLAQAKAAADAAAKAKAQAAQQAQAKAVADAAAKTKTNAQVAAGQTQANVARVQSQAAPPPLPAVVKSEDAHKGDHGAAAKKEHGHPPADGTGKQPDQP